MTDETETIWIARKTPNESDRLTRAFPTENAATEWLEARIDEDSNVEVYQKEKPHIVDREAVYRVKEGLGRVAGTLKEVPLGAGFTVSWHVDDETEQDHPSRALLEERLTDGKGEPYGVTD